ncbi:hypothetical protein BREVNS_1750 [Brevinematales bacterium NS]|nr:hypothetical protein BREVNS_1750 [Brevinematales bacterium NS]
MYGILGVWSDPDGESKNGNKRLSLESGDSLFVLCVQRGKGILYLYLSRTFEKFFEKFFKKHLIFFYYHLIIYRA